ncbi:RHS repeat domain-containing protein, partial [Variovorax beijingensis]|uniref:RHS repeat domain-containing protein n=1 Tax=Variovorax beijingensis TaxID=2496117 RepID=UPI001CB9BCC7
ALSQTTDVKALIAANGGRYDIEQDPLWNGEQFKTPQAFAKEEIAFYQCDHLGTPQELTDHEGRIAWSAQYKAWGEAKQAISEAGRKAGFRNPIRFQGQYFDDETGLHYNRYRYYDPVSGRFVSKDPIGLEGGVNVHQYAPNPIEWADPLGLAGRKTPKPRIEPGNSKEGWQHIDERHISGTSPHGPGDLFAPGTTQDQIQCLCELLVKSGTRTSNPSSRIQTFEKRTVVNGVRGRYRGVFDSQDGNRTITAFPVKSE